MTHQRRLIDGETSELKSLLSTDINGRYYIWQPWFLTGNLRLILSTDHTTDRSSSSESNNVGGSFDGKVLPLSRFPLSFGYSKSGNSISDSASFIDSNGQITSLSDSSTVTNYFITQSYLGKRFKLSAGYNATDVDARISGKSSTIKREFDMVRRDPGNDISLKLLHQEDQQKDSGEARDNKMAVLTHNFYPQQDFNVSNFASKIEQTDSVDLDGDGTIDQVKNDIDQLTSVATWRSSDKKLHVNGNLRYTGVQTAQTGQTASAYDNINSSIGGGARYTLTDNIFVQGAATHTESELNGEQQWQNLYSVSLDYHADTVRLSEYVYTWGGSVGKVIQEGSSTNVDTLDASLNHNLSRNWIIARKGQLRASASQNYSYQVTDTQDAQPVLTQGARLGYSESMGNGTQYAQGSYNETRSLSGSESLTQQINLQYSRQYNLSSRSSLNGSLTHQQSIYSASNQDISSESNSITMSYTKQHSFSFQTLSFNSSLRYSMLQSNISENSESYSWENILKHQIGMVSSSLMVRTQNEQNQQSSLILLTIKRKF